MQYYSIISAAVGYTHVSLSHTHGDNTSMSSSSSSRCSSHTVVKLQEQAASKQASKASKKVGGATASRLETPPQ